MKKQATQTKAVNDADGPGPITVVLKLDLHCDGCAKKIKKSIRYFEGVGTVKADSANNKLTITGKVDPVQIKERVEYKTKKKVEVISPKPKKDDGGGENKSGDKPADAKSGDQKPQKPKSTTVVLKISLHCDGCIHKIKRVISKVDGVESVILDATKNLVTVKGTMNTKELIPYLKEKLRRNVDIVPPKKEDNKEGDKKDEKKVEGGVDKKEKEAAGNAGDEKKKNDAGKLADNNNSGEKKKTDETKAGDGKKTDSEAKPTSGGDGKKADGEAKPTSGGDGDRSKNVEVINRSEYYRHNPYKTYTMPPVYNQNYYNQDYGVSSVFQSHRYMNEGYAMEYPHNYGAPAPPPPMFLHNHRGSETDIFSTENPNACSVM